ncbi:hypothetical protein ABT150_30095 [Streptomyces mirabilis]|uniref:hypothetical protein n=1 Tax=Streptomyces mirabilis TaxID=68239 RepID=UPI0033294ABD
MWFFDAVGSGFQHPTDPGRLQWFRIVFGTVCTARFALSIGQGGWDRLVPGSISLHLAEQRFGAGRARLLASVYRPVLIVRTVAALALAAGLVPRLSLLLLLAGAAMELLYLARTLVLFAATPAAGVTHTLHGNASAAALYQVAGPTTIRVEGLKHVDGGTTTGEVVSATNFRFKKVAD